MFRVIRKTLILLIVFLSFSFAILIHSSDKSVKSNVLVALDNHDVKLSNVVSYQTSTTTKNLLLNDLTMFYNNLEQNDKYILTTDKFNCTSNSCITSSFSKIGLFSISEYDKLGGINSYLTSKLSYFAIDNGTIKNITSGGIDEASTSSGLKPTVYLQDYVTVTGSGTQSDPFKLKMPEYVVTINLLNGTVTLPSKMITRGESVTFEITPNIGYKLVLSSNTCSSGTLNGNIFTITNVTENQTCNISLMPENYTLTLNPNGGSVSSTTTAVTYDSTYGELPTSVKEGYTFSGWYTSGSGGTKIESTTQVKTASNHTLYAQWTLNKYTLTLTKSTGVSTIYYKINGDTSYTSATSTQNLSINYGTTYTYYGVASTGYTISSCTESNPCTYTMGAGAVSKTLSATLNKYTLTLTKGTGISTIYYKINGASSYSSVTSTQSLSVNYGTTYTYYGVASTGYVMTTCTESNPCIGTMGTSTVNKTLTATKGYTVTLNIVNGTGSATQIVEAGSNATFTGITPNSGYIISDDDWDAGFSITSTDTDGVYKIVLENITSNTNYTFKFVYEGYSNRVWQNYRAILQRDIKEKLDTNDSGILSNMVIEENSYGLVGVISTEALINLNLLSSESSEICADFNVSGGCVIVMGHRLTGVSLTIRRTQTGTNTYVYNDVSVSGILD